jgi:hypothetical protein
LPIDKKGKLMSRIIIIILAMVFSTAAFPEESTKLSAVEHFEEQKVIILKDIADDVIYNEISFPDVKVVKHALDMMSSTLDGVSDVAELTEEQRGDLFNNQGLVNTILTMAENDSRMVCRRSGRLGTNFKTTTCETVRDRRERQRADRLAIDGYLRGTPLESN